MAYIPTLPTEILPNTVDNFSIRKVIHAEQGRGMENYKYKGFINILLCDFQNLQNNS